MGIIEIIIIAIVEAMDCFAVSIATGLSKKGIKYSRAMLQAVSFGVFQGGMTLLGYFLGVSPSAGSIPSALPSPAPSSAFWAGA